LTLGFSAGLPNSPNYSIHGRTLRLQVLTCMGVVYLGVVGNRTDIWVIGMQYGVWLIGFASGV